MIRVGRRKYDNSGHTDPSFPGFSKIICLTKSSPYGDLGPYVLRDEKGNIVENVYQASKVYGKVPKTRATYSRYDSTVIWNHPAEVHAISHDNEWILTAEYWNWRRKLESCEYPVRYPVGRLYRKNCLFSIKEENGKYFGPLDYIAGRKGVYIPLYCNSVRKEDKFHRLKRRLESGENLLIIEVDGPHQESLEYYTEKYNLPNDFIVNDTMLVTPENITVMLNDPLYPFGHGYCLGLALLGLESQIDLNCEMNLLVV